MSDSEAVAIGIDVGGHRLKAGIVRHGKLFVEDQLLIVYPSVIENPGIDKADVPGIERVEAAIKAIQTLDSGNVTHIGIATTGTVDINRGIVLRSQSASYQGTNWPQVLAGHGFSRPKLIYVQNDAKCGAWAEYRSWPTHPDSDSAPSPSNFVYVTVGSGIGSGIILNGHLINGAGFVAGEITYVPFRPESGVKCKFGMGCVEAYAAAPGILREAREGTRYKRSGWAGTHRNNPNLSLKDIEKGVKEGDDVAILVVETAASALGTALAVIINLLGPEVITIGGGVVEQLPRYFEMAGEYARNNALPPAVNNCLIAKSQMQNVETAVLGAAYLAFDQGYLLHR